MTALSVGLETSDEVTFKPSLNDTPGFSITYQKERTFQTKEQLVLMPSDRCKLGIFGRLKPISLGYIV